MNNLEIINTVNDKFKEGINLLKMIKIDDMDEIKDILTNFGSSEKDDGGIFSQLKYITDNIIEKLKNKTDNDLDDIENMIFDMQEVVNDMKKIDDVKNLGTLTKRMNEIKNKYT